MNLSSSSHENVMTYYTCKLLAVFCEHLPCCLLIVVIATLMLHYLDNKLLNVKSFLTTWCMTLALAGCSFISRKLTSHSVCLVAWSRASRLWKSVACHFLQSWIHCLLLRNAVFSEALDIQLSVCWVGTVAKNN